MPYAGLIRAQISTVTGPAGVGALSSDWARVATDWDGVHLTLMSVLTAPFVQQRSTAGTTMMW